MEDGTVHITVGAAGFFLIQLSWVIRDGRNTTRLSLAAMVEQQWSIGLPSFGNSLC